MKTLREIQNLMKVPKNERNNFGKYDYRKTEGILRIFHSIVKGDWSLIMSDEIVDVGGRIYVRALAELESKKENLIYRAYAFAREPNEQKGMQDPQVTGSASSYARKYALCGLLAIDDGTRDPDMEPAKKKDPPKKLTKKEKEDRALKEELVSYFMAATKETPVEFKSFYAEFFEGKKVKISSLSIDELKEMKAGYTDYLMILESERES